MPLYEQAPVGAADGARRRTRDAVCADFHHDDGVYLLGALRGIERDAFEQHLANCPACTADVAEMVPTRAQLDRLVGSDVLEQLTTTRQRRRAPPTRLGLGRVWLGCQSPLLSGPRQCTSPPPRLGRRHRTS